MGLRPRRRRPLCLFCAAGRCHLRQARMAAERQYITVARPCRPASSSACPPDAPSCSLAGLTVTAEGYPPGSSTTRETAALPRPFRKARQGLACRQHGHPAAGGTRLPGPQPAIDCYRQIPRDSTRSRNPPDHRGSWRPCQQPSAPPQVVQVGSPFPPTAGLLTLGVLPWPVPERGRVGVRVPHYRPIRTLSCALSGALSSRSPRRGPPLPGSRSARSIRTGFEFSSGARW